ncbi:hypothetical protein CDAR_408931 [Caerostris darwini]|uniref:Uncharacterized protein n=1 Tax=Caerostris darwini TaxID=1538125 RepID=A0AAV4PC32_9ARAC|nr:hypothetical protein CDAR_408931 [Caerostris darwini]
MVKDRERLVGCQHFTCEASKSKMMPRYEETKIAYNQNAHLFKKETKVKTEVYEAESITPPFPSRRFSVVTINNVFMRESFQRKRKDREDGVSGGLSMLIKTPEIKLREIVLDEGGQLESSTEVQAAEIYLPDHSVSITNGYHPDNTSINIETIEKLIFTSSDTTTVLETPQHKRKALLKLIPVVDEVFSKLNVDEMDPLRKTPSGKRYLIAIMCLISRYPDAIPALAISSASVIDFLL